LPQPGDRFVSAVIAGSCAAIPVTSPALSMRPMETRDYWYYSVGLTLVVLLVAFAG
jgi:hypothetical protein